MSFVDVAVGIWRFFLYILSTITKCIKNKKKEIEDRTIVDLTSNKSAVSIHLSSREQINIILRIANFTPAELKVKNITLKFTWDSFTKEIYKNNLTKIKKHSEAKVFFNKSLIQDEVAKIEEACRQKNNDPIIEYTIDFSNRGYEFQKEDYLRDFSVDVTGSTKNLARIPENK